MGAELVKKELETFLKTHVPDASLENMDEIALSYISDMLSELSQDDSTTTAEEEEDSSFDVEQFCEMISAYIPEFSRIESSVVCEWLFELAEKRQNLETHTQKELPTTLDTTTISLPKPLDREHSHIHTSLQHKEGRDDKRESNDHKPHESTACSEKKNLDDENITHLSEMFPDLKDECIQKTFEKYGGDMELVIPRLLAMADNEPKRNAEELCLLITAWLNLLQQQQYRKTELCSESTDIKVKESVLARFAYVDTDEDKATHCPVLSKPEPKKMVRYRDSQVVNTKGERYTVLKKNKDTDSEDMKKTYVNLNPLRKYRFH